ncbi:MAG: GIY-YIG nuclease family protein [Weeksellaceae bacterium]|nr:GIY-YIG nuclease family protein [Weeksellaceae bacterium]
MNIIKLLNLTDEQVNNSKVHFATGTNNLYEALYVFFGGKFKEWQEVQNRLNFNNKYIFSLIYFKKNEWLFAGIYEQINVEKKEGKYFYKTEITSIGNELIGRLIIRFEKKFRSSYTFLKNSINSFELIEIMREKYTTLPFPGFSNININFEFLTTIMRNEEQSWKTALSNSKGVYLITDAKNGKLYVGAAYSENAFWSRWASYCKNGHGGNTRLEDLIRLNGFEYAKNLHFSILETRNTSSDDDEIREREKYWKSILLSKEFGYNDN